MRYTPGRSGRFLRVAAIALDVVGVTVPMVGPVAIRSGRGLALWFDEQLERSERSAVEDEGHQVAAEGEAVRLQLRRPAGAAVLPGGVDGELGRAARTGGDDERAGPADRRPLNDRLSREMDRSALTVIGPLGPAQSAETSCTVTRKVPLATLPSASVAVQVTVVVPTGKSEPDAGVQATAGLGSWASLAVGAT
jgi:hypothetical protein